MATRFWVWLPGRREWTDVEQAGGAAGLGRRGTASVERA